MSGHMTAKVMSLNEFPGYFRGSRWGDILYDVCVDNTQIDILLYLYLYIYLYT